MRLLVPDGARRQRLLQCEARAPPPPAPAAAAGGGGGGGRTVVVGIRRDAASRELLTWALVKVANAGDRVVALHVAAQHVAAAADGNRRRPLSSIPNPQELPLLLTPPLLFLPPPSDGNR